jgi:hypothetical protein
VECRAASNRLRGKWFLLYKDVSIAQNIFQVSFKQKIKTLSGSTDPFDTRKCLRQGDSLSCMLFNFSLEKVVREAILDIKVPILHKSVGILAHAGEVVIVEEYEILLKMHLTDLK